MAEKKINSSSQVLVALYNTLIQDANSLSVNAQEHLKVVANHLIDIGAKQDDASSEFINPNPVKVDIDVSGGVVARVAASEAIEVFVTDYDFNDGSETWTTRKFDNVQPLDQDDTFYKAIEGSSG